MRAFLLWLQGRTLDEETVAAWKAHLTGAGFTPATVNGKLAAVNALFRVMGRPELKVKYLKLQRRTFRARAKELSHEEYECLIGAARAQGKERLALLMEAICATGIRVSEVRYLTVEAARKGEAVIFLKGKVRTILLPGKLARKLRKFAVKNKIASGEIFLTGSGKPISRKQIWAEMKQLCRSAGVEPSKVFPHNLRHLFATAFYKKCRDIVRLADVLGHSSVETTRIYLMTTDEEHRRFLDQLRLVS